MPRHNAKLPTDTSMIPSILVSIALLQQHHCSLTKEGSLLTATATDGHISFFTTLQLVTKTGITDRIQGTDEEDTPGISRPLDNHPVTQPTKSVSSLTSPCKFNDTLHKGLCINVNVLCLLDMPSIARLV